MHCFACKRDDKTWPCLCFVTVPNSSSYKSQAHHLEVVRFENIYQPRRSRYDFIRGNMEGDALFRAGSGGDTNLESCLTYSNIKNGVEA